MRPLVRILLLVLATPLVLAASPPPGSGERAHIMDALRPNFEGQLGGPVKFVVKRLVVDDNFAYVDVRPRQKNGRPYRIQRPGWMDAYGGAVLEKKDGVWRVIDARLGPTDVWYCGWSSHFSGGLPDC